MSTESSLTSRGPPTSTTTTRIFCARCSAPILPSGSNGNTGASSDMVIEDQPTSPSSIIVLDTPEPPASSVSDCSTMLSALEPSAPQLASEPHDATVAHFPELPAARDETNLPVPLPNTASLAGASQAPPLPDDPVPRENENVVEEGAQLPVDQIPLPPDNNSASGVEIAISVPATKYTGTIKKVPTLRPPDFGEPSRQQINVAPSREENVVQRNEVREPHRRATASATPAFAEETKPLKRKDPPRRDPVANRPRLLMPLPRPNPPLGCWNCSDVNHRYPSCPEPFLRRFCFHCGSPGFISTNCPYCDGKNLKEGRDYFRRSRK